MHYKSLYLAKLPKKEKKTYSIPKATIKRQKQNREYLINRGKFIERKLEKNKGILYCYFCDKIIHGEPSIHHLNGRDDEDLLDESYWIVSHNYCHVFQYHSIECKKIPWFDSFLEKLKIDHPDIYIKELQKLNK